MDNKLFRKPKKIDEVENKYQFLGFTQNPFPSEPAVKPYSPDSRVNGSIFLDKIREGEIKDFKDHIVNAPNKIGLLMDYAAYKGRGIGKTAFLNHMKKSINSDLGDNMSNGDSVLYAVYVSPSADKKSRTLNDVAHSIFTSMHSEGLFLTVFCRLRAMSGLLDDVIDDSINDSNYEDTIANDDWLKEHGVDIPNLNKYVLNELVKAGLADDNSHLFGGNYQSFMALLDDNKNDFFWKKDGLTFFFDKIEKLLKAALFTNCIILLDEAEKMIQYQNFNERRAFCDNLRYYFIDGNCSNAIDGFFKIVLTIHPNSQELLMPHWGASGLDRFCSLGGETSSDNSIFFKPMSNDALINELTEIYLKASRINKDDASIKPFTEDAISYAMEKSDRIPGKFLRLLYLMIEKAVQNNWNTIDKNKVDLAWKESNKNYSTQATAIDEAPLAETKTEL
jgi:hypothetical protein